MIMIVYNVTYILIINYIMCQEVTWNNFNYFNNNDFIFLQKLYSYFNLVILTSVQSVLLGQKSQILQTKFV